ncbi:MAG: hypothetical protein KGL43_06885 [Burkholderiales bacterium]|nr:hypothetical protein [Burkholderiales bacterium]MDE2397016.1 hypothetical protein [Burkholderiales bacterium]MDE2453302.1 hypothetical protein [Burkholderiales bacterium]
MNAIGIYSPFAYRRFRLSMGGTLSLCLIYVAIYLKDWASGWMSSSLALGVLVAGLAIGFGSIAIRSNPLRSLQPASLAALLAFVVAWCLTLATTDTANLSSYYLAIPCAFVIVNTNPSAFFKVLLVHLVLTITIQFFEYASGQYFFVYQASDGTQLNEELFGGGLGVFRAKGLFQGPLSAVAFAYWMAFLSRGSMVAAGALFLCAFLASGRLGMLTACALIAVRMLGGGRGASTKSLLLAFVVIALGAAALFASADADRLYFISTALDLGNSQNQSRFEFWLAALTYFLSYSPLHLIFGNFGFILHQEGGSESDFLRLLLDCGVVGFGIYIAAIGALIGRAFRRGDREGLFIALTVIALMNIFPFVQSLSSSVLFWMYVIATLSRPRFEQAGRQRAGRPGRSARRALPAVLGTVPAPMSSHEKGPV